MILQPLAGTGLMKNVIATPRLGPHNGFASLVHLQANAAFAFARGSANAADTVDNGRIGVGFQINVVVICRNDLEHIFNRTDTFGTTNGSLMKKMRQGILGHYYGGRR